MGISSALGSSALLPAGLGFRNKIINGAMVVAQRGTAAVTGSGSKQFAVDRWMVFNGTGTVTFQQSSVAPPGYTNSLVATVTATGSYGTTGYTQIGQFIEGYNVADLAWGTANAKPVVLSFWTRASVTGTYSVAIQNGAQTRSYPTSFTVNSANTWEYKTLYINGDTTGTWATDNTAGMTVWFNPGMGSSYDATPNTWGGSNIFSVAGTVDFAANSGATFYITGVQLEQNYQPTPFEQRPFGIELALCQRYYFKTGTGNSYSSAGYLNGVTTTIAMCIIDFPNAMRVNPTSLEKSGNWTGNSTGWTLGPSLFSLDNNASSKTTGCIVCQTGGATFTAFYTYHLIAFNDTNAYFAFNAEL